MNNFVQKGRDLTIPAPYDVASGQVVIYGRLVGVAVHAAKLGEPVTMQRSGVFTVAKPSALVLTAGGEVYGEPTTGAVVDKATGKVLLGAAMAAAGNGTATVDLCLHGGVATVAA